MPVPYRSCSEIVDWNPVGGMGVCSAYSLLSGGGLCDELITRPEDSYWQWCDVCDLETSSIRSLSTMLKSAATGHDCAVTFLITTHPQSLSQRWMCSELDATFVIGANSKWMFSATNVCQVGLLGCYKTLYTFPGIGHKEVHLVPAYCKVTK
jgi:hypothetical protein